MPKTPRNNLDILQKKVTELEVMVRQQESVIATHSASISSHLNQQQLMEIALQELEFQKQESDRRLEESDRKREELELNLEEVSNRLKKKEEDYDRAVQQIMELQRNRFGRKCERFVDGDNSQIPLFPMDHEGPEPDPEDIETVSYQRKKRGGNKRRPLDMSGLPHREEIIPVNQNDLTCSCCGRAKKFLGYHSHSRLHVIPAQVEVVVEKREKFACENGCEGQFVTAAAPLRVLPKSIAGESLVAHIIVSKVVDRQPLYHLEKAFELRHGWKIGRNMMARWMILVADQMQPLINLMKDQLEDSPIAAIDATSFHVLNEPGRASQTKSYAYCIRGGPPGREVILYEYNAYRHADYVKETLANFAGILHCDASPVFNAIGSKADVTLSYCHAHARRKFEQIQKSSPKGKTPLAAHAMRIYQELYAVERQATEDQLSPEDRHVLRQEKSRPILEQFHQWLLVNRDKAPPKSPIGQAIVYCLTHWEGLMTYLTDGRVEIDNNATERDIKPFVIARKNFLFACTQKGADSLGIHFSLVFTARRHGLDPMVYYTQILKRLPYCVTPDDYAALLPWNFK